MTQDQIEILVILWATVGVFLWGRWRHDMVALALILVVTMTLSDFMNNAATAAVMCPIAISIPMLLLVWPP